MEKYYEKIKLRMVGELILAIILIPVAIYTSYVYFHMDAPLSGNDVLDFFGGFVNGVRSSLIAGFIIYLTSLFIRDIKAVRQESRLKELFIAEHDERLININETASRLSFHIILYVIIVAALIWGLYDASAGLALFCVWIFIVITRIVTTIIYSRRI
jgi:hypothetical protein